MLRLGALDKEWREFFIKASRENCLFWINTFVSTFDPRDPAKQDPVIPWITWPCQDNAILKIIGSIGKNDLVIEKSRDMGATWMCLAAFNWMWQFQDYVTFLMVSRVEDMVDKTEDPKSLFWKIDFMHAWQPGWLMPAMERVYMHYKNLDRNGTMDGESTTKSAGRGDRRTAVFFDEFGDIEPNGRKMLASSSRTTNSRIFNSTHQGNATTFYELTRGNEIRCKHILQLPWWLHPEKGKGLYYDAKGKPRSPAYDAAAETTHPKEMAQEWDMDPQASQWQFFEGDVLDRHAALYARKPAFIGELDFDEETLIPTGFREQEKGRLAIWCTVDRGKVRQDLTYGLGVDVSMGTGASNSAICGGNRRTGEKLFEFIDNRTDPKELARYSVAMARWLTGADASSGGCLLIWEANGGPGRVFGDAVKTSGYRHCYFRKDEEKLGSVAQQKMGWWAAHSSKLALLSSYRGAMKSGEIIERSAATLAECRQFVYDQNSKTVSHAKSANSFDPSDAGENHGDAVTATALFNHISKELRRAHTESKVPIKPPEGSFAYRREMRMRAMRRPKYVY